MKILLFCFFLFIGFTVSKKIDPNIILTKENTCKAQATLLFQGTKMTKQKATLGEVYEMIKQTFIQKKGKFVTDIFRQPLANLLVSVDGLDESVLSKSLASLNIMAGLEQSKCFSYASSISRIVSLMTGKCPLKHKIFSPYVIQDSGAAYHAFSRQKTYSEVSNVADDFLANFKEPTVVSMSSSSLFAKATSSISFAKNVQTHFWENNQFENLLKKEEILSALKNVNFGNLKNEIFTVQFNKQNVKFDLKEEADFMLFAELLGFKKLVESIPKSVTTTPSLYSLTFASLKEMIAKYGVKSSKYEAAVYLIDRVTLELVQIFSSRFDSRTTSQIVLLGGVKNSMVEDNEELVEKLEKTLSGELLISFRKIFPLIYLKSMDETKEKEMCEKVKVSVENQFKVSCLNVQKAEKIASRELLFAGAELLQTNETASTNETDKDLAIADWQTQFWTGLIIAIFLYLALYVVTLIEYNDITSYIVVDIQDKAIYERDH